MLKWICRVVIGVVLMPAMLMVAMLFALTHVFAYAWAKADWDVG